MCVPVHARVNMCCAVIVMLRQSVSCTASNDVQMRLICYSIRLNRIRMFIRLLSQLCVRCEERTNHFYGCKFLPGYFFYGPAFQSPFCSCSWYCCLLAWHYCYGRHAGVIMKTLLKLILPIYMDHDPSICLYRA